MLFSQTFFIRKSRIELGSDATERQTSPRVARN